MSITRTKVADLHRCQPYDNGQPEKPDKSTRSLRRPIRVPQWRPSVARILQWNGDRSIHQRPRRVCIVSTTTATLNQRSTNVLLYSGWSAWLNGEFITSYLGNATTSQANLTLSFTNSTLHTDTPNVLLIVHDDTGHDQTTGDPQPARNNGREPPRLGLGLHALASSRNRRWGVGSGPGAWRVQRRRTICRARWMASTRL
jgi:hypothetical protein